MSRLQSAAGRVPQRWSFGHWPLRRKLAAAIVLPVLLAFVFGGLRVKNDFDSSRQLSQAADTVLVIRPVVDYNLAVQRLAAAESVGGGGVIAAITKYESAAADLRIALKAEGVPESVKASGQSALALGQAVRTAKTQSPFSDIVIDKSGNIATLMSAAVSDLGLSDDSASAKIVVALQDSIAAQRAMTGEQLNLSNTDDASASLRAIGQVGAETAALTRLLSTAPADQVSQARQLLNENGRRNYTLQQQPPDKAQIAGLGIVIESSNAGYAKLMDGQLQALEANLRDRAAQHRAEAILNAAIVVLALAARPRPGRSPSSAPCSSPSAPCVRAPSTWRTTASPRPLPRCVTVRSSPSSSRSRSTRPRRWASSPAPWTTSTPRPARWPVTRPASGSRSATCSRPCRAAAPPSSTSSSA